MKVQIIRVNGSSEEHEVQRAQAMRRIRELLGAECLDTVNLRNGLVMCVDDNGYETECIDHGDGRIELRPTKARKPVNPEATKRYLAICRPGTTHQIVGDVAIVRDADFE